MIRSRRQVSLALVWIALCLAVTQAAGADEREAAAALRRVEDKYSLKIVITRKEFHERTTHGRISGGPASRRESVSYAPLFAFEFALYPIDAMKKSRLKAVVLCTDLSFQGQRRNAIPDFEHDVLYLDVARGRYSESYTRKVIHHEFFHIIDWRDDGKLYKDDGWAALNRGRFVYGAGGRNAQDDSTVSLINDKLPGFLNKYSTMGVEEDKAEIFANMIVNYRILEQRSNRDRVIALKVERMKQLLNTFSPKVDSAFWKKIRKLNRPAVR